MQTRMRDIHDGEHDRERERDRQCDDGAGSHAEAHEAADEDDQDRLPQGRHEIVDRHIDGDRLVGNQRRLDSDRQVGLDVGHLFSEIRSQCQDIAGVTHGDRETDRGLAVDAEHRLRRVDETAAHGGDIAQPDDAVTYDKVDCFDVVLRIERTGDAQEHALLPGLDHARRPHQVLCLQCCDNRRVIEPQAGKAFRVELDEDLLVLRAHHLDLRDIRHLQQARTRRLDVVAQLAEREAVGGEGVDDAEGVAEIVVEERADNAGRQRPAHVADVLAHLIPNVRDLRRGR